MTDRFQVDVIMGGPGHEAVVSRNSGAAVAAAARAAGFDVAVIDIAERLAAGRLRPGSVVFNIVHGSYGEDGTLQAELEALGQVYLGSDAASSALCMDKEATRCRLREAGLPVAWGLALDEALPEGLPQGLAFVLKPRCDGSSVGVYMVADAAAVPAALARARAELGAVPMLLEQRLRGDEFTVGLIDDGAGNWQVLPPIRIAAAEGFYDYQAKYSRNDTTYDFALAPPLAERLGLLAVAAVEACGCRELARVDLMADGEDLYLLEINTLPGFTDHSLVPKAAARAGIEMAELVERLVLCAHRRSEEGSR